MPRKKLLFLIGFMVILSGCSSNVTKPKTNLAQTSPSPEEINLPEKADETDTPATSMDERFAHDLELGTYEEIIALNGKRRDTGKILMKEDKVLFPQGSIRSMFANQYGRDVEFIKASKDEVLNVISTVEDAELVNVNKVTLDIDKVDHLGMKFFIILLNSEGSFVRMSIEGRGNNYHLMEILYEGEEQSYDEDVQSYFLHSEELTKIMKDLGGWKDIDVGNIKGIKNTHISNSRSKANPNKKEFDFTPEENQLFLKLIKKATLQYMDLPAEDFCYIVKSTTDDNQEIKMKISRGSAFIGLEGRLYRLEDEKDIKMLNKLLE